MRASFLISLVLVCVLGSTFWYQSTASECPVPIHYRLGHIDDSFGISFDEAEQFVLKAEAYWESSVGRELFVYDEEADFTVDFMFDERQETADAEERQKQLLDDKRLENEEIKNTVEELQSEYERLSQAYEAEVVSYEADLFEYNKKVNKYNDRGGAPEDIYQELQAERDSLNRESAKLNKTAVELNDFADEINKLSSKGNSLVSSYNEEVGEYNDKYGFEREFTQGDYQGDRINVYKFSSDEELLNVLAHEFGHALGLDHVEDESSLMYYLLENTDVEPSLSSFDKLAFYDACGEEESFEQNLRKKIRGIVNRF